MLHPRVARGGDVDGEGVGVPDEGDGGRDGRVGALVQARVHRARLRVGHDVDLARPCADRQRLSACPQHETREAKE